MDDLDKALLLHRQGKLDEAEKIYLDILKKDKNNPEILQLVGTINLQTQKYKISEEYFLKSLNEDSNNPGTLNNLGLLNKAIGNFEKSKNYFEINIEKNNFEQSWVNKSNILLEYNKDKEGLEFTKEAYIKFPKNRKIKNNLAVFYFKCGYQKEALSIYSEFDKDQLHFTDSYLNYANILIKINNYSEALKILNTLIFTDPQNQSALRTRSFIYKNSLEFKKAEDDLSQAIKIDKLNFLNNKMLVEIYIEQEEYQKAITYCDSMIDKNIEINFFLPKKIFCKMKLGIFTNLKNDLDLFSNYLDVNNLSLDPLSIKYINDDGYFQKRVAKNYWEQRPKNDYLSKISNENNIKKLKTKIRIGYFSGDFKEHAVFQLIQDLFLNHDKSNFEIYAYSTFKKEGFARNKIIEIVDKFYDIDDLTDEEILKLVVPHSLDIAIDLSGYTGNTKSHLFEYNISKIKINYLGFPGTMGTNKYDYIIADQNIIPKNSFNLYSEKVLYMPEVYQPFSPRIFDFKVSRTEFNLPENVFIMGCFSRIEKILPNIFNIWMNVLSKYRDVYLALCIKNEAVLKNITNYCNENNFNSNQILFLETIEHKENLRRMSTFNLYLDSFPYNGHTGISDSLFQSCVPTISFTGNSFASRVSFSLLKSLRLDQLITYNESEYLKKIEYYCENREELVKIRKFLINHKKDNINRMKKFTKDFEMLILSIIQKE